MCKSSNYYRKNKKTQNVVHLCPHCDYSTTGPKITLKHHILAKHTKECDRPFQCMHPGCERGFAQKIHLDRHLCKVHGEKIDKGMSNFQYDRHNNYIMAVPITENFIINNVIVHC